MDRVLIQVPQWAGPIPWVGGAYWDPELCLRGGATILITSYARNSFLELEGGSRGYVSQAILIKCEPK